MRTTTTPKYITVRDDMLYQIRSGQLQSGERVASRREICEKYGISNMTAYKVQAELQKTGLTKIISGQGLFVNNTQLSNHAEDSNDKLKKVRIIGAKLAIGSQTVFGSRLITGMREQCDKSGLEFNIQYIDVSMPYTGILRNGYKVAPDEGLVFFSHSLLLPEIVLLLMAPKIRTVLINNFFQGSPSVFVDNRHGIHEIFDYVESKGCKKIFYAANLTASHNKFNENEHIECFKEEIFNRKLNGRVMASDNYNEVVKIVAEEKPEAVLFPSDTSALIFRRIFQKHLNEMPLLIGFDNISDNEPGLESLTTYEINCKAMGIAAIELLQEFGNCNGIPFNRRIPGKMLIR
ncbi:MAG: GntR family transcriptional regulator [Victivallaceae bacterium]|nr:GntR family transcriptional regulator [Victivallaceae bacterium]